jgi:DNA-binding beta-propeller fold protein YncE
MGYHDRMDYLSSSPLQPGSRQRARRARQARRVYWRRRALAALVVLAVLVAVGYGIARLVDGDETGAAQTSGASLVGPDASSTGGEESKDTSAGDSPGTAQSGDSAGTSTTSSSTTTSVPRPNLDPQELTIKSSPDKVDFTITLQDNTTITGTTPFTGQVPGGDIRVEFVEEGYNRKIKTLNLSQATSFKVWLDPEGQLLESVVRFNCGSEPKQVAFSPDGKELWVTLLAGGGIQIFDPFTGTKLDEVSLGGEAVEVIFTKDGKTVYTSQMTTGRVYEIDAATREIKRKFFTKGEWTKILELSPDEKTLWASNWVSNNVSEIDLTTGEVVRLLKTVGNPRGLYCTADGKRLYVAGFKAGELQRFDLETGESTIVYDADTLRHFVADEEKGLLYMDDLILNECYVMDLDTEKVTKLLDTDQRPNTMDLSPDGKVLYISNRGQDFSEENYYVPGPEWGDILVVDTATGTILDAIVGGNQCTGLDVSPDGKYLAFSDFLDQTIRVYAIPDYATLAAGGGGRADERFEDIKKEEGEW